MSTKTESIKEASPPDTPVDATDNAAILDAIESLHTEISENMGQVVQRQMDFDMVLTVMATELGEMHDAVNKGLSGVAQIVSLSLNKHSDGLNEVKASVDNLASNFDGAQELIGVFEPILVKLSRITSALDAIIDAD